MAIPIADLQKQIQTPNVEKGQTIDLSGNIKELGAIAQDTLQQMQHSTNIIGKFMIAEKKAEEEQKANDAFTDFAEKSMTALQGLEQTEAHMTGKYNEKTYTPTMEKLDTELISKINSIEDPVIREKLRQQANDFKLNQKIKASGYVFSQKKAAEKISSEKFIETKQQTFLNDITYDSENNLTVLERDLREIEYKNQSTAISVDGVIDPRYVALKTQESADKMVENAVTKMEQIADSQDFFGGYAEVKKFLEKSKKYLSPEKFEELASSIDSRELEVEILRNTDKFLKDGVIDRALVYQHGKNLSYYEKEKIIQNIEISLKGKQGNLSKEDLQDKDEMEAAQANMVAEKLYGTGLKPKSYYNYLAASEELSAEELAEIKAKDFKDVDPIKAIKAYNEIQSEMEKSVTVRSGKQLYIRSKEAENASKQLAEYLDFFINTYDDQIIETDGIIETVFGKDRTIEEEAVHRIIEAARVKDKDGNVIAVRSRSALAAAATFFRNTKRAGIDTTQKVKDSPYEKDSAFQTKLHFSLADAFDAGQLSAKTGALVDSSFSNSYNFTLSQKFDNMQVADDFLGPENIPNYVPYETNGVSLVGTFGPTKAQIDLANNIKKEKYKKQVDFIKKQEAARAAYKKQLEEEAKKEAEKNKKKMKQGAVK